MIMRQGQQLLLPANPLFIWGSLILAFLWSLFQNMGLWGRAPWVPDVLAVTLVFWGVHQPQRVGVGLAFVFGLLIDVHQGSVLGQNALAYTVLNFFATSIHLRLLWFTVPSQACVALVFGGPCGGVGCAHARGRHLPRHVFVVGPGDRILVMAAGECAFALAPATRAGAG
jgi:rod shape-determining protein MreD